MSERFPLALPENTVLAGQYIIQKPLGQGGFGITYKALDRMSGKEVAVKEYFPESMATRTPGKTDVTTYSGDRGDNFTYGKECFVQEAETLAQFIGNDNIVRIYSYFEEYGTAYFVMDYIEGTPLDEYVKLHGGKITFEEAADILVPVMDALGAVHEKGIVHRDVSPDNIYITKDGKVKLIDFGAARQSLGDKSQSLDVILKHGFAPKEQYMRRGKQGPFTDIYALGATFYYVLTGKRPPDALERIDEDEIIRPSTLGVKLSKAAEEAILIALNVQPSDRFQSMAAFKNAMLYVREEASQRTSAPSTPLPTGSGSAIPTTIAGSVQSPQTSQMNPTGSVPYNPAVKNSGMKKKPIIIAVVAALVILIAIFAAKKLSSIGGGSAEYPIILGNNVNNLSNASGIITEGSLEGKPYLDLDHGSIPFRCLSVIDGVGYALNGRENGKAVTFKAGEEQGISGAVEIPELSGFSNINRLYVSKYDYYIFTSDRRLLSVSRSDGSVKESMFSDYAYHEFTFTESGKHVYIDWGGEHGQYTIYVTPAGKIDSIAQAYYTIPDYFSGMGTRAEVFSGGGDTIFVYLCVQSTGLNSLYKFDLGKSGDQCEKYNYGDDKIRQLLNTDGEYVYCGYGNDEKESLIVESLDLASSEVKTLYSEPFKTAGYFDNTSVYPDKKGQVSIFISGKQHDFTVGK